MHNEPNSHFPSPPLFLSLQNRKECEKLRTEHGRKRRALAEISSSSSWLSPFWEPYCSLKMGTLAPNTGCGNSEQVYLSLGLKRSSKGALRTPRVLALLSSLLEKSVHTNEKKLEIAEIEDKITVFHGVRVPSLSIGQYVDRVFKYSCCSPSCFVVAQIYVDRFLQRTDVQLTSLNVHRLLITSVMLAAKFIDDAFFNNAYYAKVGGVSTAELNRLEMKFLFSIDFKLQVNLNTFEKYCAQLDKEVDDGFQIERPIQACRIKESWLNREDSANCTRRITR